MRARPLTVTLVLAALGAWASAGRLPAQDLLIRDGRVITIAGPELPRGSVLIQDGRIAAVGTDVEAPAGTAVLDAAGRTVMPAFVLAHTSAGLDRPNEMMPVVPFVSVLDSIDPSQPFFEDSLRDGHLTVLVMPGERSLVGGMGRVVHPYGLTVEDMTVDPEPGLKISLVPSSGNRATWLAQLRKTLDEARRALAKAERDSDLERTQLTGDVTLDIQAMGIEERRQALVRLLKGDLRAYVFCETPGDVVQALRLAEEYGLKVRLICGPSTWRAAELLARKRVPVILEPELAITEEDPMTGEETRRIVPRIFHDAGVRFAVTSDNGSFGRRYLWYQAACLVRWGIPRAEALAAVTRVPAELIGLGDRKGTLEKGKDADVLVLSDDPLSGRAWVDRGYLAGRLVYDRQSDPRLEEVR